jgi:NAD(P)-dependent dehydrogenase (short-subunit alcohol dehydrogenase family)
MTVVYGMERCILVAPGDTDLGMELTQHALRAGMNVICTSSRKIENPGEDIKPEGKNDSLITPHWNMRSLLSARNVLLSGLNTFGRIDEAILIHTRYKNNQTLHEVAPVSIEKAVDTHIKSHFFILKELLSLFLKQQNGILALAIHSPEEFTASPLDASAIAGFNALANSLFTIYQNEKIDINAFESETENTSEYAEFILDTHRKKAGTSKGKWYHFGDGPFGNIRRSWK